MIHYAKELRHSCKYLIVCTVFGFFVSILLLYREYNKSSFVNMLLRAQETMPLEEINCSGLLEEDVPVRNLEEVVLTEKSNKMKYLKNYKNPCWYEFLRETSRKNKHVGLLKNNECPLRLRCLPYFMIIGQPKCATTDLYFRLSLHPQIEPASVKGPHWWTRKRYNGSSFAAYVRLFDEAAEMIYKRTVYPVDDFQYNVVTGEASTSTLWDTFGLAAPSYDRKKKLFKQKIAAEIKSLLPNVKLIVILRDPVERLYSDYLYFKNGRRSPENFHLLANKSVMVFSNCTKYSTVSHCLHNYYVRQQLQVRLNLGIYSVYLQEWYDMFPDKQIFVINFDDYISNMKECLMKIFHFLRLRQLNDDEASEILAQPPLNVNQKIHKYGKMLPQTKEMLENFYGRFNVQLARLLHNKSFLWKRSR